MLSDIKAVTSSAIAITRVYGGSFWVVHGRTKTSRAEREGEGEWVDEGGNIVDRQAVCGPIIVSKNCTRIKCTSLWAGRGGGGSF